MMRLCFSGIKYALIGFVFFSMVNLASAESRTHYVGDWYQQSLGKQQPVSIDLFEQIIDDQQDTDIFSLQLNREELAYLLVNSPAFLNLSIPYGDQVVTLNLARVKVTGENFFINTDKGRVAYSPGIFYRGLVNNNPAQIASFSIFDDDVIGFYSTDDGNFVIGGLDDGSGDYVVYNDHMLPTPAGFDCSTIEDESETDRPDLQNKSTGIGCKTVNVYFECDYALYQSKGANINNLANFVTGFFNEVSTLYANENIGIQISDIFVWTTPDPFASYSTASAAKNAFQAYRGVNFNGDLAHLLTTRSIGGGVASLNVLCYKSLAFGASQIYTYYSSVPTYSWTVEVVTHELGHNIGSWHTQNCAWVGGSLDNCYAVEGQCSPGPAPTGGGTIMSYCHTTGYGINFNKGFGQQPGDLIRTRLLNSCLPGGGGGTAPTGLFTTGITGTAAQLNWVAVTGATQYNVQYRTTNSSSWITAGTTTNTNMSIAGLSNSADYLWHVSSDCSAYSADQLFTTLAGTSSSCPAPTGMAANNITQSVATLSWIPVAGATSYQMEYKLSTSTNWIPLSIVTAASISVSGLSAGMTYNWRVKADCSVFSSTGSFSTQSNTTTPTTGCAKPGNLAVTNQTPTSATLTWSQVSGAQSYQVRFQKSGSSKWTNYNNVAGTSLKVTGLVPSTTYNWMVSTKCGSKSTSGFTSYVSFTTSANMIMTNEHLEIQLYPNPVVNTLQVFVSGDAVAGTAEIVNLQGSRVALFELNVGENKIGLDGLADGLYVFYVRRDGQQTITRKFMKSPQ